jgi:hypothetical protein
VGSKRIITSPTGERTGHGHIQHVAGQNHQTYRNDRTVVAFLWLETHGHKMPGARDSIGCRRAFADVATTCTSEH